MPPLRSGPLNFTRHRTMTGMCPAGIVKAEANPSPAGSEDTARKAMLYASHVLQTPEQILASPPRYLVECCHLLADVVLIKELHTLLR